METREVLEAFEVDDPNRPPHSVKTRDAEKLGAFPAHEGKIVESSDRIRPSLSMGPIQKNSLKRGDTLCYRDLQVTVIEGVRGFRQEI